LIQEEMHGKGIEVLESFSEAEDDEDAGDGEEDFSDDDGEGSSSGDDGDDDGADASSEHDDSSPKVDITG
jgi:hypothetical protein